MKSGGYLGLGQYANGGSKSFTRGRQEVLTEIEPGRLSRQQGIRRQLRSGQKADRPQGACFAIVDGGMDTNARPSCTARSTVFTSTRGTAGCCRQIRPVRRGCARYDGRGDMLRVGESLCQTATQTAAPENGGAEVGDAFVIAAGRVLLGVAPFNYTPTCIRRSCIRRTGAASHPERQTRIRSHERAESVRLNDFC
jgi:hypothetical protein